MPVSSVPPLAERFGEGLLFFPVTAFDAEGAFAAGPYRAHVAERLDAGPTGVFAACGTGEFSALAPDEYEHCVTTAVDVVDGRVPVIAGAGYGTALAREYARAAERAGADGLLVLPPYGADGGQAGLVRHYTALAESTSLDLILYQRDSTVFTPDTVAELAAVPTIVGFKDGRGDLDLMQRIVSTVRAAGDERFLFFNGMPTAEMTQRAYRAIGVPLYSSAVFCFAPGLAKTYHAALASGDTETLDRVIETFLRPYVELRNRRPGYAVSLVKALTRALGPDVGAVRAPLTEPEPADLQRALDLLAEVGKVLG